MTKQKSIKRAMLMSLLALVVCLSMFVGSTFAWFTDSVTSVGNIIKSGKLDVTMEWADGKTDPTNTTWKDASTGAIFNSELWEPGYVEVRHIKIANAGTLALKYQLNILANGAVSELADVIDVYYVDPAQAVANRDALANVEKIGTLSEVLAQVSTTAAGELKAGENHTITLALKMQETAGNEYQDKSIGSDFSVQLLATQLTYEGDSFDNQYDVEADYIAEVKTADELATALRAGGLVKLANDISVTETLTIPAGVTVNLDLNGKTITGTEGRDADNNRIHVIVNNGILTIKDGTVKSAGNDGGSAIYNNAGATFTIEDVTLYGAPQSDPVYETGVSKPFPSYAVNNYGNAVVNGATVKSYHGAIATGGNGVTVINDADIDVGLGQSTGITSYAIYSYENAQVTVNGGKFAFTKQEVYVNGGNTFCELGTNPIIINGGNYTGTSFSSGTGREYVIKGGTFDKDPSAHVADGYIATKNADGTYTVVKGATVANAADLKDALAAGGNIVLAADIELTSTLMATKDVVIDLNGKTIKTTNSSSLFQSQSNAAPSMIITSSTAGAVIDATNSTFNNGVVHSYGKTEIRNVTINAGSNKVVQVQGNGSVEIYDTVINAVSGNTFNVAGDFTLGEGTVVNVTNLNSNLINNNGAHAIVIDGAKINVGTFKVNGSSIISLNQASTLEMKDTDIKIDNFVLSPFGGDSLVSKVEGVTIENCTFDVTDSNGASCTFVAKDGKYRLVQN